MQPVCSKWFIYITFFLLQTCFHKLNYSVAGTHVTISKLLDDINNNIIPDNRIGRTTLENVLRDIGFKFKYFAGDARVQLMEQKEVVYLRAKYLK